MPTWIYPAWPIRFEDLAGNGIDFPTEALEWETSQSFRTAFEEIPFADYQYDLLGTRRGPRDLATESIRFVKIGNSGPEVFAWIQQLRGLLARVGRGRLWIRDGNGTRYWAYARPSEMPDITFGVAEIRHVPVTLRFARFSDWYAEHASTESFTVTTSPTAGNLISSGQVETAKLVIRLFASAGTVVNPALKNQTNGTSIQILRTFSSPNQIEEIDCQNLRVRYSSDGGATWSDDWAKAVIGDTQVVPFMISPGLNVINISFDPSSTSPQLMVTFTWYEAFA